MATKTPSEWSSTSAYSTGAKVLYNGVGYEATGAISANANGNDDPVDNGDWDVYALFRIEDRYSLAEAVENALGNNSSKIKASIPLFINEAERKVSKILRLPGQIIQRTFELDADSKFAIPTDILEVLHLRINTETRGGDLKSKGSISLQSMDRTSFELLKQNYSTNGYASGESESLEYPGYYWDGEYFYVAPSFDSGTEVEMEYYGQINALGTTVLRVNDDYEALNEDDQTLAEWIAADSANNADNFVQAEDVVDSNLWIDAQPHILKAGALVEAFRYLQDESGVALWDSTFKEHISAAQKEIDMFDTSGSQSLIQKFGQ